MKAVRSISFFLCVALLFCSFTLLASCDIRYGVNGAETEETADRRAEKGSESDKEHTEKKPETNKNMEETSAERPPITLPQEFDPPTSDLVRGQMEFALKLFKTSIKEREDDSSTLISPLSVALALAMTANGAKGETLAELERLLGMPVEELNEGLRNLSGNLSAREDAKLHLANSIWFREERMRLNEDFASTVKQYFNADVLERPFDQITVDEINGWVKENTDGMIDRLLEQIDGDVMTYLINALVFDAKWEDPIEDAFVLDGVFTSYDGTATEVEMLSTGTRYYLNDGRAQGFLKRYEGNYSFVALLPEEGISVYDYIAELDGASLYALINDPLRAPVYARIPQFKYEYSLDMTETLKTMGLSHTFAGQGADFSGMGETENGPLAISRVLHKTAIELTQAGTKAAAVTAVEMVAESAEIYETQPYRIYLNRPFVYMIVDNDSGLPIFMGTFTKPEEGSTPPKNQSLELTYRHCFEAYWYEPEEIRALYPDYLVTQKDPREHGPVMLRIDSEEEFLEFSSRYRENDFARSISLPEGFFDESSLLLTYFSAFSGSAEYKVEGYSFLSLGGESMLTLEVEQRCPYWINDDVKHWFFVAGIPKEQFPKDVVCDLLIREVYYIPETETLTGHKQSIRVDHRGEFSEVLQPLVINPDYHTPLLCIKSRDELEQLTALMREDGGFDLDNTGGDLSYNQLFSQIDDRFFYEYNLLIAYVSTGSGSVRYTLDECNYEQRNGKESYRLLITAHVPESCTMDMAGWFVCGAVSKLHIPKDLQYIVEYKRINEASD